MTNRTEVRCPNCGETKESRGQQSFRCCGTTHKIENHRVEEQQGEKLDPQAALGKETDNMTEQEDDTQEDGSTKEQKSEEQQQEQQEEEYNYRCDNCGHMFNKKLLKCSSCGKRFDW